MYAKAAVLHFFKYDVVTIYQKNMFKEGFCIYVRRRQKQCTLQFSSVVQIFSTQNYKFAQAANPKYVSKIREIRKKAAEISHGIELIS